MNIFNFSNPEHGLILTMILIIIASVLLGAAVKKVFVFFYRKFTTKRKQDPGKWVLMLFVIRLSILFAGIAYAISLDPNIESATTSFLASAGVATIIVGFAAKDALSNLVSGIMIIIFRPFTISHWIKVGDVEGTVEQIKMLHTVIKDPHNRRLIIPNSKIISSEVINSSYGEEDVVQIVEFDISYESDIDKAKEIIREVAEASPLCRDKRSKTEKDNNKPKVEIRLKKLGSYSMTIDALVWVDNPKDARRISWALNEEVRKRFTEAGIVIPYPNLIVRDGNNTV